MTTDKVYTTDIKDEENPRSFKIEYDEWMTSKEAANLLKIGVQSLMNMASNGQIPYFKLGRRNRYRRSDLVKLLLANARGGSHGY